MKCDVCEQDGLRWYSKLLMAFTLPMKCKSCDARYELGPSNLKLPEPLQSVWDFLMDWVDWLALLIMLVVIYFIVEYLSWAVAIFIGVVLLLLFTWFIPHRLNVRDPVNDLVLRIQAKKRQIDSSDCRSDK